MSGRIAPRRVAVAAATAALVASATLMVTGCGGAQDAGDVPPPTMAIPERTETVSVFFATGRSLTEERRLIDVDDKYAATLAELMEGVPEETPDIAIVQPEAEARSVTLEDGLLTIDWERTILDFTAEPEEYRIAHAAFLVTFGQFAEVERVAFTVEGKDTGTIDGKDIGRFWGEVTLADQPWDVARPPGYDDPAASEEETPAAEAGTE